MMALVNSFLETLHYLDRIYEEDIFDIGRVNATS
jgi:hypothetical protein